MKLAPYRKAVVAVGFGLAEVAAYIVANPADLPGWAVGAALGVNAAAVYAVRNRLTPPTPERPIPTRTT